MDSCSKQQGRNIIFTNNKQTNNFSINSIKQQDLTTMNKTFTNAGFNWTDELIVHAPGWGNGFMVESLPVFELLSRYITRHHKTQQDKTRQDKNEDDWNRRSDMHDSDNYRNLPQCLFIQERPLFPRWDVCGHNYQSNTKIQRVIITNERKWHLLLLSKDNANGKIENTSTMFIS